MSYNIPGNTNDILVSFEDMKAQFHQVLLKYGMNENKAVKCSEVFAENSVDGVYTHGVNRFTRFIQYIKDGLIEVNNEPVLTSNFGALEQWNGQSAPGILNALFCTNRAMEIAEKNGIGCLTIAQTNHWMRGGTYGWKAAKKGFAFICWTNTIANMPAWGAKESRLGNNPLIIAVPYKDEAIVLDMAISQFSFGKMEQMKLKGEELPVAGGYDEKGELSKNPSDILETNRSLPIGYWKGSGLALLLDILATILSGGSSTQQISNQSSETNVSQVFIAIDISKLHNHSSIAGALQQIIEDYKASEPIENADAIRYPGEGVVKTRQRNMKEGIPVAKQIWGEILNL